MEKSCCHFFCLVPVSLTARNRWRNDLSRLKMNRKIILCQ